MSALGKGLRLVRLITSITLAIVTSIHVIVTFFALFSSSSTSWGHMCPLSVNSAGVESSLVVSTCDWMQYMDSHECPFERIAYQCNSVNSACNCDKSVSNMMQAQTANVSSSAARVQLRARDVVPKCAATSNTDFIHHTAMASSVLLLALTIGRYLFDTSKIPPMGAGKASVLANRGPTYAEMVVVMLLFSLQLLVTLHRLALTGAIPGMIAPGVTTVDMHTSGAKQFHNDAFMHSFLVCVPDNEACGNEGGALDATAYTWRRLIDVDFLGVSVYAVIAFTELIMFYLLLLELLTVLSQYLTHDKNSTPEINNKESSSSEIKDMVMANTGVRMRKVQPIPVLVSQTNHQ